MVENWMAVKLSRGQKLGYVVYVTKVLHWSCLWMSYERCFFYWYRVFCNYVKVYIHVSISCNNGSVYSVSLTGFY